MPTLSPLFAQLLDHSQSYEFFQAVRLMEQLPLPPIGKPYVPVGHQQDPEQETLRFRGTAALRYPSHEIDQITLQSNPSKQQQFSLHLSFFSIFGACGILPHHYTESIIQRLKIKDAAFKDFLDVLNHRMVSLFYRAWQKHHLPALYEAAQRHKTMPDAFTQMLYSLTGNGTDHLQNRLIIADNSLAFYSGNFANARRSANQLQRLLSDYLQAPITILQCQPKWFTLAPKNRSSLQKNNQLGRNVVLGQHLIDAQDNFRIQAGPLTYAQFQTFSPYSRRVVELTQMVKRYVGLMLSFDIQLILNAAEVPACRLSQKAVLGWNTWLKSKPFQQDAADSILLPSEKIPKDKKHNAEDAKNAKDAKKH